MPPIKNVRPQKTGKANFKSFGKLLKLLKDYKLAVIFALLFAVIGTVAQIIGPDQVSKLVDKITEGIRGDFDSKGFTTLAGTLATIYLVGALLSYIQQFIMATVTQRITKKLRTSLNKKINKLPLKYFDSTTTGDMLSRVTNDVDTIGETLNRSTANLVSAVVLFIGIVFMMFKTNVILSLTAIGTSIIGFLFMMIIMKFSQRHFNNKQIELGKLNGHIEEIYTHHNIVNVYNGQKLAEDKFKVINNQLYNSNWKSQFLSGLMMPIMSFVGNLSYLSIFVVGIGMIVGGNSLVTLGTISAFTIYARLFSQPLSTIAQSMSSIQQASAASSRVFELLDRPEQAKEDDKISNITDVLGNVEFKNVKFGYNEDKIIINDFSAKLSQGQKVAIVGPTGAGKTTIVNLLMKFYEVTSGDILIDGISIKDMKRECVHDLFDMILQDTWLFKGTVRENLIYNKKDLSDENLDRVCHAVGLDSFIKTLPKGYDTVLSDSVQLSEGQKQQLTIARAMIKDAPLLILDEATSSVDTRTELIIQKAMDDLTINRTSFVIAHRLSTIKNADVILVLKDGDIIEQGNHDELLAKNGFYADLYNSQFQNV